MPVHPTHLDDPCTCSALRRATRRVTKLYDEHLAGAGLTVGQYSILRACADDPEPHTIGSLAEIMVMDRTATKRALTPLERDGLIELRPDPRDVRAKQVIVTPAGRIKVEEGREAWRIAQREFANAFGEFEAAQLRQTLAQVQKIGAES